MLQVNALFACILLTTEYDDQLSEAIITLATSGKICSCDGLLPMNYLRWQIEIIGAPSIMCELSLESLGNSKNYFI